MDFKQIHSKELPAAQWQWVSQHLPIACVDLVPVLRDSLGAVEQIGLIRRDSPFGQVWCHLGGRVMYGETLHEAGRRHLSTTLSGSDQADIVDQPFFVNQYFPVERPEMGLDPRKHAVAICYVVNFPREGVQVREGGEGTLFRWFPSQEAPFLPDLWPGSELMLARLPRT